MQKAQVAVGFSAMWQHMARRWGNTAPIADREPPVAALRVAWSSLSRG